MIDKKFFGRYQKLLVWLANIWLGRLVFQFKKNGCDLNLGKIVKLLPNGLAYYDGKKVTYEFFQGNCFAQKLAPYFFWLPSTELDNSGLEYVLKPAIITLILLVAPKIFPFIVLSTDYNVKSGSGYIESVNASWSTARGASSGSLFSNTPLYAQALKWPPGGNFNVGRAFYNFDTSGIDDGATIDTAVFNAYGYDFYSAGGGSPTFNIYNSNHSDSVVADDFDQGGTTAYCDSAIAHASLSTGAYNSWTMNATGKAAISKTGVTKLCLREATYDVGNSEPGDSYKLCGVNGYSTSNKDKLTITLASTAYTKTFTETFTLSDNIKKGVGILKSDIITLSENIKKAFVLIKLETITLSESFTKICGHIKSFTDTLNLSDNIKKASSFIKSETITLSDNIQKASALIKSETISLSESFEKLKIKIINLIDTLNLSDIIQKAVVVTKSETQTLSDTLSKSYGYIRSFSDTLNISDNIQKAYATLKSEIITITENISKVFGIFLTLTDTLTISESFTKVKGYVQSLTDTLNLSDNIQKAFSIIKTETLSLSDNIRKFINGMEAIWTMGVRTVSTLFTKRTKPTSIWSKRDKPWD